MSSKTATPSKKAAKKKATKKKQPSSGKSGKLNAQMRLFANILLADPNENQTKAYMEAYECTNEAAAAASASRLLKNVKVREYIDSKRDALLEKRFGVTQERIARELSVIANARLSDFGNWNGREFTFKSFEEIPEELLGAVKSIETETVSGGIKKIKLRFHNKEKALEILARHKKMLKDTIEHDVSDKLGSLLREISGTTVGPPSLRNE